MKGRGRRARLVELGAGLLGVLLLTIPAALEAQAVPGDTVTTDTVAIPIPPDPADADTIPAALAEAAESEARGPILPPFPVVPSESWATGTWVFSREQLALHPGLNLLEIIQRLPGFSRFRAGGYGRPEVVTALGLGGIQVRVVVDGREMDPIGFAAYPLESLPLQDIDRVEVRRGLGEIVVAVTTFRLRQAQPHSQVELGTGVYQTRALRALFSRGFGDNSIGTGAFDLASTQGLGLREPYSNSTALVRYDYALGSSGGLRAEWRGLRIDREGSLFPQRTTRSDMTLGAAFALSSQTAVGLTLASTSQQEEDETAGLYDVRGLQLTGRGAFATESFSAAGSASLRSLTGEYPRLPGGAGDLRVEWTPSSAITVTAQGRAAATTDQSAASTGLSAALRLAPGVTVFAEGTAGSHLVPSSLDSLSVVEEAGDTVRYRSFDLGASDRAGVRAGGEITRSGGMLGAAWFRNDVSSRVPFGLAFDRYLPVLESTGAVQGAEGYFDVAVPGTGGAVRLEGNYTRILGDIEVPYVPTETARVGAWFHRLFYGGQLEPSARAELVYRGAAIVPPLTAPEGYTGTAGGYPEVQFSLDVRILDVQAFLIWNNALYQRSAIDFPGAPPPFPRIVYGAKWRFTN